MKTESPVSISSRSLDYVEGGLDASCLASKMCRSGGVPVGMFRSPLSILRVDLFDVLVAIAAKEVSGDLGVLRPVPG